MHLKRLNAPDSWPIKKKGITFITRQSPGAHKMRESMPMVLVLREMLDYAKTTREAKMVLHGKNVLVDKKVVTKHDVPVGLMDRIEITKTGEHFTLLYNEKGKFHLKKTSKEEANTKICKIIGKKMLRGKKLQLNLYDGKNIVLAKNEYAVGDSVVISLPDLKIKKHLKCDKGAKVYITSGKHVGKVGEIKEIHQGKDFENDRIVFKSKKDTCETLKSYAFVIEKEFGNE